MVTTPADTPAPERLGRFFAADWDLAGLVEFPTRHKLELFSHDVAGYRHLGRLVGAAGRTARAGLERAYREAFLATLAVEPTRARHVDTLSHAIGHLRGCADAASRQAIRDDIEGYRRERLGLEPVRSELRRCAQDHQVGYLLLQTYLLPEVSSATDADQERAPT